MAAIDDLRANLDAANGKLDELKTEMEAGFARLQAKIDAGQDVTAEAAAAGTLVPKAQALIDEAKAIGL